MSLRGNKTDARRNKPARPSGALMRRIALRDILAHKSRSLLILALIALPLTVMAAAMVVVQSGMPTRAEAAKMRLGNFDTQLLSRDSNVGWRQDPTDPDSWRGSLPEDDGSTGAKEPKMTGAADMATLESVIPRNAHRVALSSSQTEVQGNGRKLEVPITVGQISDPLFEGRYELLEGHWDPSGGAVVTPDLAALLKLSVGDPLQIGGKTLKITGIALDRSVRSNSGNMVLSSLGLSSRQDLGVFLDPQNAVAKKLELGDITFFVQGMVHTLDDQARLNSTGIASLQRSFLVIPPQEDWSGGVSDANAIETLQINLMIFIVAFFVFLEVGMLAGAAFAVGAKKQTRVLSLLASNGAGPGALRGIAGYTGLYLGLAGVVLGTTLGTLLAWLTVQWGNKFALGFPGWHIPWAVVFPLALLALLCTVAASLLPSWVMARKSALGALRTSAGPSNASRKTPVTGYCLLALGLIAWGIALYLGLSATTEGLMSGRLTVIQAGFAAGLLLCTMGIMLSIGSILGLAGKIGHRLPLASRLAFRDVQRNAGRNIPVVASVIAGVSLASALTIVAGVVLVSGGLASSGNSDKVLKIYMREGTLEDAADAGARREQVLAELNRAGHVPLQTASIYSPYTGKTEVEGGLIDYDSYSPLLSPGSACRFGTEEVFSSSRPNLAELRTRLVEHAKKVEQSDRFTTRHCNVGTVVGPSPLSGDFDPIVTDRAGLELILGKALTPAISQAFSDNKVIVSAPEFVTDGGVLSIGVADIGYQTLLERRAKDDGGLSYSDIGNVVPVSLKSATELDALEIAAGDERMPRIIAPAGALVGTGAQMHKEVFMVRLERPMTLDDVNDFNSAVEQYGAFLMPEGMPTGFDRVLVKAPWLLAAAAGLLVLTTTVITTGLALADGRTDARTLTGIGANSMTRRRFSGTQAGLTALLGTGLGVLLGALPMLLLVAIMFGTVDVSVLKPLALLLALPVAAGLIGWLMVPRTLAVARVDV